MIVGINYPSSTQFAADGPVDAFGWDFGDPPLGWGAPPWRREAINAVPELPARRGETQFEYDLRVFRRCGIGVLRWFVLPDGLTYGYDDLRGCFGDACLHAPRVSGSGWAFRPPPLPDKVRRDFVDMLTVLRRSNRDARRERDRVLLMPCFISFDFCRRPQPGHVITSPTYPDRTAATVRHVKGGRDAALSTEDGRSALLAALTELLLAAHQFQAEIYAWDVMNEPEWATVPRPDRGDDLRHADPGHNLVRRADMSAFLTRAVRMVRSAGFKSTIGFAKFATQQEWTHDAEFDVTHNQFHWYGHTRDGQSQLPAKPAGARPMVVGEMTSHPDGPFDVRRWIPASGSSFDGRRPRLSVWERLHWVQCAGGHDVALLWDAARRRNRPPADRLLAAFWDDPSVRSDVARFTNSPVPCEPSRAGP